MQTGQQDLLDEAAEDAVDAPSANASPNHAIDADSQPTHALATRSQNAHFAK